MTKARDHLLVIPALVLWAGVVFCAVRGCRPDYGVAVGKEPNAIRILSSHHALTIKGCTFAIEPNAGYADAIDLDSDLPVDSSTRPEDYTSEVLPPDYVVTSLDLDMLGTDRGCGYITESLAIESKGDALATVRGVATHKPLLDINDVNCLTDASIRRLASSGRLCKVLGHPWKETTMSTASVPSYPVFHCQICGIDVARICWP